jgi:hypothetical protein
MATKRKRTTTKTGNFTKRTVTISSKGTRITNSFRPPGGATRRTSSINLSTGKTRITHTTHQGNGWSTTRSKSGGIGKYRSDKSSRSSYSSSGNSDWIKIFFLWIYSLLLTFFGDNNIKEKSNGGNDILLIELEKLTEDQQKILIYDAIGKWITNREIEDWSNGYKSETIIQILEFDWNNFDFDAWRKENGYSDD